MSLPAAWQASRMVLPSGTVTGSPSTVNETSRRGAATGTSVLIPYLLMSRLKRGQLADGGLDGAGRGLAEAADGRVAHDLSDLGEQGELLLAPGAGAQQGPRPGRPAGPSGQALQHLF